MATTIIKLDPADDFYVMWSSIVEAPTAFGTREEMFDYLKDESGEKEATERLERTDRFGTSALWGGTPRPYGYDDNHGMIYMQRGIIRRSNLKALCERLAADEDPNVADLLEPFDED